MTRLEFGSSPFVPPSQWMHIICNPHAPSPRRSLHVLTYCFTVMALALLLGVHNVLGAQMQDTRILSSLEVFLHGRVYLMQPTFLTL